MNRAYQIARDKSGSEWDKFLSAESRARLLKAHGINRPELAWLAWKNLPPSVKNELTESRLKRRAANVASGVYS